MQPAQRNTTQRTCSLMAGVYSAGPGLLWLSGGRGIRDFIVTPVGLSCEHVRVSECVCVRAHACMCVRMRVHAFACACEHTCACNIVVSYAPGPGPSACHTTQEHAWQCLAWVGGHR